MSEPQRARPGEGIWREDEADARLRELSADIRRLDVERAILLARVLRSRHYRFRGCASLSEYGRQLGLRACETWDRAKTGLVFDLRPDLIPRVAAGEIALRAGGSLHDVLALPDEDPETWIERARSMSTPAFCARVEEHVASRCMGGEPVRLSLVVSPRGKEMFDRARHVAETMTQRALSQGETLELVSGDYVDRYDRTPEDGEEESPRRTSARRPPAPRRSKSRHVPANVRRKVRKRDRGRCRAPGCQRRHDLHLAHIIPYRLGGPATVENILQLCSVHNQMMEAGLLRIRGDANHAVFLDAWGRRYALPGGSPDEPDAAGEDPDVLPESDPERPSAGGG